MYPSQIEEWAVVVDYDQVATPQFDPPGGDYMSDQTVSLTTATSGATIYYRIVDGEGPAPAPVPDGPDTLVYTGPVEVSGSGTQKSISAIAVKEQMRQSPVSTVTYTIGFTTATAPVLSLGSGPYHPDTTLGISSPTTGVTFYYTTDGSVPTTSSPQTNGTLRLGDLVPLFETRQITVIAGGAGIVSSDPVTRYYAVEPIIRVTGPGDSLATDGVVTLREAITAANTNLPSGDAPRGIAGYRMVITLDTIPALDFGTVQILLSSPLPAINRDLIIEAVPARRVVVSGRNEHRVFSVSGGFVTLYGFEVAGGRHTTPAIDATLEGQAGGGGGAGMGGGLYVNAPDGAVRVDTMVFRDNYAVGGRGGNASPVLVNSMGPAVEGAPGAGPNGGLGGSAGTPVGQGGGFASGGGGGYQEANGGPGGLFGGGGGGGRADNGFDGGSGGFGGLFGGRGQGTYSGGAGGGGGGAGIGGAIAIVEDGVVTIRNSSFIGNHALGGESGQDSFGGSYLTAAGEGKGGAIFVHGNAARVGAYADLDQSGNPVGDRLTDRADFINAGNTFTTNDASDAAGDGGDNDDTMVLLFLE